MVTEYRGEVERLWHPRRDRQAWDEGYPHPDKPWLWSCVNDGFEYWSALHAEGVARTQPLALFALYEHWKVAHGYVPRGV